jgi:Phage Mu protein F like protein
MSSIDPTSYRNAFVEYLRKGTPIRLSNKQGQSNGQYVWRTSQDEKVRSAHRANDGHLFNWSDPPETGHPGEDYNCRCEAIPYAMGATEFAYHDFPDLPPAPPYRWGDVDFVAHYYYGAGVGITLSEIGHLQEIIEQYAYRDGKEGAYRRLSNQIADAAREAVSGNFHYDFELPYDFGDVEFSHGFGTVSGLFVGTVSLDGNILRIAGKTDFSFTDEFKDPAGMGIELGGTPYGITGGWSANFFAEVFVDTVDSQFTERRS